MLDTAVIVVSWNVCDYLRSCLAALFVEVDRSGLDVGVWVVDNQSQDGTVAMLTDEFPQVHLLANDHNPGFGAANNQGMQAAAKENPSFYFLLNPDTVLQPGALVALVTSMQKRPSLGMVGARLLYGDGRFQHSAFAFPGLGQLLFDLFPLPGRLYESRLNGRYPQAWFAPDHAPFAVDFCLGAAMLVRAAVAKQTGGFDERYHMYCEEIDWAWRMQKAGWRIMVNPAAEIIHFGGESTRQIPAQSLINLWRSRAQLYRDHYPSWRCQAARLLVTAGMRRKARQTDDPTLKAACQTIVRIWQKR